MNDYLTGCDPGDEAPTRGLPADVRAVFDALLSNRRLRGSLNEISSGVLDDCDSLLMLHARAFDAPNTARTHDLAEYVTAFLFGWMIGMGPGRMSDGAGSAETNRRLLEAAAYGAKHAAASVERQRATNRAVH